MIDPHICEGPLPDQPKTGTCRHCGRLMEGSTSACYAVHGGGYDNKYWLGVTGSGYYLTKPVHGHITDAEAIELAALIVAMKPKNRALFEARLKAMQQP